MARILLDVTKDCMLPRTHFSRSLFCAEVQHQSFISRSFAVQDSKLWQVYTESRLVEQTTPVSLQFTDRALESKRQGCGFIVGVYPMNLLGVVVWE